MKTVARVAVLLACIALAFLYASFRGAFKNNPSELLLPGKEGDQHISEAIRSSAIVPGLPTSGETDALAISKPGLEGSPAPPEEDIQIDSESVKLDQLRQLMLNAAEDRQVESDSHSAEESSPQSFDFADLTNREMAVAYFEKLNVFELEDQIDSINVIADNDQKRFLLSALFEAWSKSSPSAAIAFAQLRGDRMLSSALEGWAHNDWQSALAFVQASSNSNARVINNNAVISGGLNPDNAAYFADYIAISANTPGKMAEIARHFAGEWANMDLMSAADWIRRLDSIDEVSARAAASAFGSAASASSPQDLSIIISSQSERIGNLILAAVARDWTRRDMLSKIQEFASLNPNMSPDRVDYISVGMGDAIMNVNPALAASIYSDISDKRLRDSKLVSAANISIMGDHISYESAMSYVLAVQDAPLQIQTAQAIYTKWRDFDSDAALAFLADGRLSEELRAILGEK